MLKYVYDIRAPHSKDKPPFSKQMFLLPQPLPKRTRLPQGYHSPLGLQLTPLVSADSLYLHQPFTSSCTWTISPYFSPQKHQPSFYWDLSFFPLPSFSKVDRFLLFMHDLATMDICRHNILFSIPLIFITRQDPNFPTYRRHLSLCMRPPVSHCMTGFNSLQYNTVYTNDMSSHVTEFYIFHYCLYSYPFLAMVLPSQNV